MLTVNLGIDQRRIDQMVVVDDRGVKKPESNGTSNNFLFMEPLADWRKVSLDETRIRQVWAHYLVSLLDDNQPDGTTVILVRDNLNTHGLWVAVRDSSGRRDATIGRAA